MKSILLGQTKGSGNVRMDGGGIIVLNGDFGEGPYTFEFDEEGSPEAIDIGYDNKKSGLRANIMQDAIDELNNIKSNPNLLDNWYFVGGGQFPINQLGQKEYTTNGYTIDRWRITNSNSACKIEDGFIRLTNNGTQQVYFFQFFENKLPVGKYTLSILCRSTQGGFIAIEHPSDSSKNKYHYFDTIENWDIVSLTVDVSKEDIFDRIAFRGDLNCNLDIIAAKLELGPAQTLAHKEGDTWILNDPLPNFQQELAKCQRYQFVSTSSGSQHIRAASKSNNNFYFDINVPTTMRANPTVKDTSSIIVRQYGTTVEEEGFNFTFNSFNNSIRIDATKNNHGLSDATLILGKTIFDANL